MNEPQRASILQRTLIFMSEVLARSRFARLSGQPTQRHYIRRPRPSQPVDTQDESGTSRRRQGAAEEDEAGHPSLPLHVGMAEDVHVGIARDHTRYFIYNDILRYAF